MPKTKISHDKPESKEKKRYGKKYRQAASLITDDPQPVEISVEEILKSKVATFDPTVELHLGMSGPNFRGQITLPAGVAKQKKVLVIDDHNLEEESKKIEQRKINFDILLTKPEMMPKIARLAKILGPKGLMPNPKSGTVTDHPEKVTEDIAGGKIEYKQDKDNLIHLAIGKHSFGQERVLQNLIEVLRVVPNNKIISASLNLTMGPSIKLDLSKKIRPLVK